MFKKTSCGLPGYIISIMPLTRENKDFVTSLDREKLYDCKEFNTFYETACKFQRCYTMSPWIDRDKIKLSFHDELTEQCEILKAKLNEKKKVSKERSIEHK